MSIDDGLMKRWQILLGGYAVSPAMAGRWFDEIRQAYSEPHRHYHTLHHLEQVFSVLEAHAVVSEAMVWSVWFHDVIYQPGQGDNEERSALLAVEAMQQLSVGQELQAQVKAMIMATRTHDAPDRECQLFLDADMSILGAEPAGYAFYVQAVRQEFMAFPDDIYAEGRKHFLHAMLARPQVFLTEKFQSAYESKARWNLEAELASFSAP